MHLAVEHSSVIRSDALHEATLGKQTRRIKLYGIGLRAATIPGDPAAVECVPDSSRRVFL
jgi:hypothetical protein